MYKIEAVISLLKDHNFDTIKELLEISYFTKEIFVRGLNCFFLQGNKSTFIYFATSTIDLINVLGDFDTIDDQQLLNFLISELVLAMRKRDDIQPPYLLKLIELGGIVKNPEIFCSSDVPFNLFIYYAEKNNIIFDSRVVKSAIIGSNTAICDWIFQQWIQYTVDLQIICEMAIAAYSCAQNYFALIMQKTYDSHNTHIVAFFIISIFPDYNRCMNYMISSPYYEEILLFCSIKKMQTNKNDTDTDHLYRSIQNDELAEKSYKIIIWFLVTIQRHGVHICFDFNFDNIIQHLSELLKYQYNIVILIEMIAIKIDKFLLCNAYVMQLS